MLRYILIPSVGFIIYLLMSWVEVLNIPSKLTFALLEGVVAQVGLNDAPPVTMDAVAWQPHRPPGRRIYGPRLGSSLAPERDLEVPHNNVATTPDVNPRHAIRMLGRSIRTHQLVRPLHRNLLRVRHGTGSSAVTKARQGATVPLPLGYLSTCRSSMDGSDGCYRV